MDRDLFFSAEFEEHMAVVAETRQAVAEPFQRLLDLSIQVIQADGKLLFFGNGGSAGDAQHLATELTVRYKTNRKPIAALALTTDTSALTAIGNDLGFEDLFARQVEALARPGDLCIGISTSGNSENVNRALKAASTIGAHAAALAGKGGGPMAALADPCLIVPSDTTARIQEMHIMLGQMLCGALEIELGLV